MRIQYCSDLHLEFDLNNLHLVKNPLPVNGDILILAGDIVPIHDEFLTNPFFSYVADNYEKIFWVPGNHEYYHKDLTEFRESFSIDLRSNLHILNNMTFQYGDIHFVFSTLWSEISPVNARIVETRVADFACITNNYRKFKATDFNRLHTGSLNFLRHSLNDIKGKTVIVTHHLPSCLCNSPDHSGSPVNEAFCADLTELIINCDANFWIYGHSHYNQKPLYIGNTIMLTNQLGYVHLDEHGMFRRNAYFVL